MSTAIFLLFLAVLPFVFLSAALLWTRGRKLSSRILWTGLAVLISLPFGIWCVMLPGMIEFELHDVEPNPGQGIAALPLLLAWAACAVLWCAGTVGALALKWRRDRRDSKSGAQPR